MHFKIDWASHVVGSKFTVFALFHFVFEGNFPSTSPPGGLYLEGRFDGGFLALPIWGAYFRDFTVLNNFDTAVVGEGFKTDLRKSPTSHYYQRRSAHLFKSIVSC